MAKKKYYVEYTQRSDDLKGYNRAVGVFDTERQFDKSYKDYNAEPYGYLSKDEEKDIYTKIPKVKVNSKNADTKIYEQFRKQNEDNEIYYSSNER